MHAAIFDRFVDRRHQQSLSWRETSLLAAAEWSAAFNGLRESADQRRWQEVRSQAQKIRGQAELLGCTAVADAAARLDYFIVDERMPAEIQQALHELTQQAAQLTG